jgi:hypothetical protein
VKRAAEIAHQGLPRGRSCSPTPSVPASAASSRWRGSSAGRQGRLAAKTDALGVLVEDAVTSGERPPLRGPSRDGCRYHQADADEHEGSSQCDECDPDRGDP